MTRSEKEKPGTRSSLEEERLPAVGHVVDDPVAVEARRLVEPVRFHLGLVDDVHDFDIVKGGEHAATDYLEEKSRDRLAEMFEPIVAEKLEEVGATAAFNRMVHRYASTPFGSKPLIDLEEHVTDGALDGLFHLIAEQEENIRKNGIARTSDLLKQVFGSREARGDKKRSSWWEKIGR